VLRRSAEHSRCGKSSSTSAKSWEINGGPARNVRIAAAQSYKRPLNGYGGRRRGGDAGQADVGVVVKMAVELEVGGSAPSCAP
jgi:hypothetical protein